ncbi:hypothetical protein MKW92_053543 [Papaver armeniacum]|nr:hypothetical protein MKW92_053543 [Papaver armeniacum]
MEFIRRGSSSSSNRNYHPGGLFASVGQMGMGFGVSPNSPNQSAPSNPRDNAIKLPCTDLYVKYIPQDAEVVEELEEGLIVKWGSCGAVSRTAVAPLETIRTHLMVGTSGNSSTEGLFRGNLINVIRVAPSKAIEVASSYFVLPLPFDKEAFDTKPREPSKIPIPPSLIAGACAGVSSTLCTYPLELVKTRLTVQVDVGVYDNLLDAFVKIVQKRGWRAVSRSYPSLIGVIPYAAANYFFKKEEISNIATLLIGSAAGAISSTATFPLEVARKQMQVGALSGRQVYKNMLHALACILEKEGLPGLYRG